MSPIKKYYTASAGDLIALDKLVNRMISEGWQPYGNPYLISKNGEFCQAMVTDRASSESESLAAANAMLTGIPSQIIRPKR